MEISIHASEAVAAPETYALPAGLLHDLRTPLNQIIGYSELLMEQAAEDGQDAFVPDISKVRSAGGELLALINNNFTASTLLQPLPDFKDDSRAESTAAPSSVEAITTSFKMSLTDSEQAAVLVVDDSENNRTLLARRLAGQGYTVHTAENGLRAFEMVREIEFDLVLLDIMMPGMDGFEVLKRLKADDVLKHIPVIMISALSETDSALRCIEMGAEDYLPKPSDPTLLRARTVACLERKRGHDKEIRFTQELQQSYRRGQELERMRDDLTSMIVNDLRSPLISVIAGLKTIERDGDLSDRQRVLLDTSLGGGLMLLSMINDLLDVNKMESGSVQLDLKEIVPAILIESALKQVEPLAASKNLDMTSMVEADLPMVSADRHKLLRTVVNLLSNAIKFTSPGGFVRVAVGKTEDGGSLKCSVSNSGEGIPATELARIFDKFGQIEMRKEGHTRSTGLGLTLCKLIIEAHDGNIWVESEMDVGSTFCFTIPFGK